ncbi:restriction endonuclease subunit S [Plesiomonas shigelloides]|uniref:restriction endonuclease subunit S n=1 Tax=Plesiomonas shigelloides TaxID=703 RepID=UPI001262A17D|nr:restriction endonuclease subunit S [Plesiomonas shigelloides]KAB7677330.1 restriction endonuclease subunit S [Plesiomonas shigelloides]
MASKLATTRLADLCELVVDCPHSTPEWTDSGFIVLRNQNIRNGVLDLSSPSFTNKDCFLSRIKRAKPQEGDLVITREAPMGEVCLIPAGLECCLGQRQVLLRPRKGVSGHYLFWALQSPYVQHQISWNEGTGTTVSNIRIPILKELNIPRLLDSEDAVASCLNSLANKITLNRQINQTLEQMAQALFKSWFFDFDPVVDNALDAGFFEQNSDLPEALLRRAEQRKAVRQRPDFKPLPAETRQLFPDAFEECEEPSLGLGGWVPKGWAGRSVSEAITVNPKVKLAKGEMAAFVDMKSLPTTGYSIEDVDRKAFSGGAKFKQHDVLFARITPCLQNGKTGFVDFLSDNENGFGSTEFIVLRGNEFVDCTYVACLARHESFRQHAMQSMVGSSGRQRVQNSCFDDFFIVIPPQNIMNKFAGIVSTSFKKLKTNSDEIISLANVRDTLLPKLISGELRLNDDGTLASGNTDS